MRTWVHLNSDCNHVDNNGIGVVHLSFSEKVAKCFKQSRIVKRPLLPLKIFFVCVIRRSLFSRENGERSLASLYRFLKVFVNTYENFLIMLL